MSYAPTGPGWRRIECSVYLEGLYYSTKPDLECSTFVITLHKCNCAKKNIFSIRQVFMHFGQSHTIAPFVESFMLFMQGKRERNTDIMIFIHTVLTEWSGIHLLNTVDFKDTTGSIFTKNYQETLE